ncbi:MAG: hypothetical protein ABEJ31_13065 [Haloarculaceae archaeon]
MVTENGLVPSLARFGTEVKTSVSQVAFWAAIVLPFLHVPLLLTGVTDPSAQLAFVGLLALNVVAAVLGQSHGRE